MFTSKLKSFFGCFLLLLLSAKVAFADSSSNDLKQEKSKSEAPKRIQSSAILREKFSLGFGALYSIGDYGTNKDTEIFSIPFRASYSRQDWRFSAQMPYLHISGPASVIAISDGAEVLEKIAEGRRQRWGNGDLRVSGQYQFFRSARRDLGANVGSTIKLPIASKKADLGSGELDYSLYTGGFVRTGSWMSNGRIGYQIMGDSEETDYNNRLYASFGSYYLIDRRYSAGINAHFKQAAVDTSDPIKSISASLNMRLQGGWRVGLSMGTGLTDSSSELFGGVQFTKSFVRKRRVTDRD